MVGPAWSQVGSGWLGFLPNAMVSTGSGLYLGGSFTQAGTTPSRGIALYHIPHTLSFHSLREGVRFSWPFTGTNFVLEATANLAGGEWSEVSTFPATDGSELVVTQRVDMAAQYYWLRRR